MELATAQDLVDVHELHGTQNAKHQQHAQDEPGVTYTVDDKSLFSGVARRLLVEIKTDQQVAAQAHALPADEQQSVIIGQHQHQHEEHKKIQVAKEPVVAVVMRHVADGVHVNQKADAGNDEDHHGTQGVEQETPIRGESS